MSHQKLTGKVAIVTGSSDGIGAGIAKEFAREGAFVTLTGRNEKKLKIMAEKCKEISPKHYKPLVIVGDITQDKVRESLIEQTLKTFGKIDILVNNAGSVLTHPITQNAGLGPLDSMLDIHVRVPYHLTKLAMEQLIKNKGVIINISSILGMKAALQAETMEYSMGKAAMDQFTQWLARELGPKGVRANSINPGVIKTNIFTAIFGDNVQELDEGIERYSAIHALQRVGSSDEIGRVAVFLASEDSSFVTGVNLRADGGALIMPVGPLIK